MQWISRYKRYLRTNSSIVPATIAPTPAQTGTFTACFSFTDHDSAPILVSWLSLVKLLLPGLGPAVT